MIRIPELLAPARDSDTGIAAINAGADAVYIGPPAFGARKAAGNSLKDIARLISYARPFHVKVYATINTLICDSELEKARELIIALYNEGVDAIIFQDFSLLKMELPPVALFASTQCHNYDAARIQWLESFGVSRFILARELDLNQIQEIRKKTKAELEFFVHGALCVSYSGRCYFSKAITGRSGNRGECAQPCRSYFTVSDENEKVIARNKHVLSLKDLNLSLRLYELYEAGITSFKIEGRLKDIHYVKNTVAYYRQQCDRMFGEKGISARCSSGKTACSFVPDPEKVFNRGFTDYFTGGKRKGNTSPDTQKSTGKRLGKVIAISANIVRTDNTAMPRPGDGICFFGKDGRLTGTRIEKINGKNIILASAKGLSEGSIIYRNYDAQFAKELEAPASCVRKIPVSLIMTQKNNRIVLSAIDNDGHSVTVEEEFVPADAKDPGQAHAIRKQLMKSGNTIFNVNHTAIHLDGNYFFRTSFLNEIRRKCLEKLVLTRIASFPRIQRTPSSSLSLKAPVTGPDENIINSLSAEFIAGLKQQLPPQLEEADSLKGKVILTTRFCLRFENGICPGKNAEPLTLTDNLNTYRAEFDCEKCEMSLRLL
jgi:putative protease